MNDDDLGSATPEEGAELAALAAELIRTAAEASAAIDQSLEDCGTTWAQVRRPLV